MISGTNLPVNNAVLEINLLIQGRPQLELQSSKTVPSRRKQRCVNVGHHSLKQEENVITNNSINTAFFLGSINLCEMFISCLILRSQ
jgi:hypothetical protein